MPFLKTLCLTLTIQAVSFFNLLAIVLVQVRWLGPTITPVKMSPDEIWKGPSASFFTMEAGCKVDRFALILPRYPFLANTYPHLPVSSLR